MKIMTVAVFVLALVFASCAKEGTPTQVSGAKDDFNVTFLFEKDGVKVYRFEDGGHYHYFTNRGETMTTQEQGNGKSKSYYQENVQ